MSSDPSMQQLEQPLRALSKPAGQSFIAWLIDRYGLGLSERLECEWLVRDAMEVIHQRSIGLEPDIEPYTQQWMKRVAQTPLTPQQLKLGRACAGAFCDNPLGTAQGMAEAYTLSGLDAAPLIRAMLEKLP